MDQPLIVSIGDDPMMQGFLDEVFDAYNGKRLHCSSQIIVTAPDGREYGMSAAYAAGFSKIADRTDTNEEGIRLLLNDLSYRYLGQH
jgi:hypothetical protein